MRPTTQARALPFYLIDENCASIVGAPRFATEDDAFDWVEEHLGVEAWNDTAVLASDEAEAAGADFRGDIF